MNDARIVSLSCRCDGITPEAFFALARDRERFYWNDDDLTLVGVGIAVEITAWGERRFATVADKARALFDGVTILEDGDAIAQPRLFGGFSFQPDFVTEHTWAQFAPAYFVLPHYQMTARDGKTWLTLNIQLPADEALDADALRAALTEQSDLLRSQAVEMRAPMTTHPIEVRYPMTQSTWTDMIEAAVAEMRVGHLKKVVLSRVCELRFDGHVDVDGALAYLHDAYPGTTRFAFAPIPHLTFFGATPELLVAVEGTHVETEALAGSIKRGATEAEDSALASALLSDAKERGEHHLVVEGIRDRLAPLAAALDYDDTPLVLRLKNIQHLHTPMHATMRESMGVLPLVELLHPTPALGGSPRTEALAFIRDAEPVPRGWYASPVGWIDPQMDGAFVVAIRSAVSQNDRVWLYAGAGIVAESQPAREWDETALKFRPMLNALGAQIDVRA
ncbi:MAG: isochorismate synthase [Chloroflexota bacterium]|nr:isochorismate synthase [Chloroflexota bacterium]